MVSSVYYIWWRVQRYFATEDRQKLLFKNNVVRMLEIENERGAGSRTMMRGR